MPEQDVAQTWKSFTPERRRGLLAKMNAQQKSNLRRAIEGMQLDSTSMPGAVLDFTSNPRSEGLYRMSGPSGTVDIPFTKVQDASAQGYTSSPATSARYRDDFNATQPSWFMRETEPSTPNLSPNTIPVDDTWMANRAAAWNAGINSLKLGGTAAGNILKRAARTAAGAVQFPFQAAGIVTRLFSSDLETSQQAESELLALHPGAQIADRLKEGVHEWRQSKSLAAENALGDMLGMYLTTKATELPGRAVKGLPEIRKAVAEKYGPRTVELAGGKIPVTVGEAEPTSAAGRLQTRLKRSGVGAPKFEKLEGTQQEAVKRVIRKVAQETSGLVGPMKEEPAPAISDAADAVFTKARPMYRALDQSLVNVPAELETASTITRQAIARAKKLGAVIDTSDIGGTRLVDRAGKPVAANDYNQVQLERRLKSGEYQYADVVSTQPLTVYMRVRSALLKMQRSTSDAALRNAIGDEIRTMNGSMDQALAGTSLHQNWMDASRLWAKAYSLRSVAEEIRKTTRGTPPAAQSRGLSPVPTRVQGSNLVNRLNALSKDGILDRAFSPEEVANLRQSADILDRAQRVSVGRGQGESMSISRGLGHAVRGMAGPALGAGVGLLFGGLRGAELGGGLGFLVQSIGERSLVGIMTQVDGVKALKAVEAARTPRELQGAMKVLATIAAAANTGHQAGSSLKALREEAARRAPAPQ